MLDSASIMQLYAFVLNEDIVTNRIPEGNIRRGIQNMALAYKPDPRRFNETESISSNYNIPAFRCAYLHKYAPLHTFIVSDVMLRILNEKMALFQNFFKSGQFNLCCLGGGPGSDAIGVLAVFYNTFGTFKSSVTLVDSMSQWGLTFSIIVRELMNGEYGSCWMNMKKENFEWNYVEANLLKTMTDEANKSIGSASFITMVKFISAAIYKDTESMVEKIFRVMKPGAFVLYIDNAAGGFNQIIERAAKKNSLKNIVGPLRHLEYNNESLKIDRFGYTSCYKTKVIAILLQKDFLNDQPIKQGQQIAECSKETVSVPKAISSASGQGAYKILSTETGFGKCEFDELDSSPSYKNCSFVQTSKELENVMHPSKINTRSSVQTVEKIYKFYYPSKTNAGSSVQTDDQIDKIVYPRILYPSKTNARSSTQTDGKIDKIMHPTNTNAGWSVQADENIDKIVYPRILYPSNRNAKSSDTDQSKLAIKQNNLNKEIQISYSRAKRVAAPYSSVESQPNVSASIGQNLFENRILAESEPETVDTCCSCCVIS